MKKLVHTQQNQSISWVGDGFPVMRAFSYGANAGLFSPFILMDYVAPYDFKASRAKRGVGEHPHRGIETVTLVYQGEIEHRDSYGGGGIVGPGDVQWMTAGSGVVHEEFHSTEFTSKGGILEIIQLWINLPKQKKMTTPRYQSLGKDQMPHLSLPGGFASLRIIAGEFEGQKGPALTHSPINVWTVSAGSEGLIHLTFPQNMSPLLFIRRGGIKSIEGSHTSPLSQGTTALFERSGENLGLTLEAQTELVILSGEKIDEPMVAHGPFVMNTREEIIQAYEDYANGKMGRIR